MPHFLLAWIISYILTVVRTRQTGMVWLTKLGTCLFEPLFITMAGFGNGRANGADWYLSAMLLAMLVIYPLLRRYSRIWVTIFAPVTAIFVLGYLDHSGADVTIVTEMVGLFQRGLLRAFGMISLGIAIYPAVTRLKELPLTQPAQTIVSLAELGCWVGVLAYMQFAKTDKYDFCCIFLITVGVILSLSHQGHFATAFDHRLFLFLGRFSLSIYLSHVAWGRLLGQWYPHLGNRRLMIIYLALSLVTAASVHILSEFLRRRSTQIFSTLRKWGLQS